MMPCSSESRTLRGWCESRCARDVWLSEPPDRGDVAARWLQWAAEDLLLAQHSAADEDVVA